MGIPYEVDSMSDQSISLRAPASASRLVASLGSLLPAVSVLAIVVGAFWFVVDLTISPLKDDVEELKGLKLGPRLASIETTLDNIDRWLEHINTRFEDINGRFDSINGRLQAIEAKQDDLIETTARLDGRVAGLERAVSGGLIVREPLPDPEGRATRTGPVPDSSLRIAFRAGGPTVPPRPTPALDATWLAAASLARVDGSSVTR